MELCISQLPHFAFRSSIYRPTDVDFEYHSTHHARWVLGARQNNHCYVCPFCLTVLQGRDMQAFVTHEHALRKKARCIFIFAMAALGLASFALIHLGDGFFVKAGVLVAVVASICMLQYSPCFLDVFKLTTSIFQVALLQPQAIPLQHLGTSLLVTTILSGSRKQDLPAMSLICHDATTCAGAWGEQRKFGRGSLAWNSRCLLALGGG